MANKIERLNAQLDTLKPHLVVLTEHGQKKETLNNTRLIDYSLKAAFCRETHSKGGVAIYTRNSLGAKTEIVDVKDLCIEMTCEVAVLKVTLRKTTLFVIGIYRTQGNLETGLEVINEVLEKIPVEKHPTILIGDINIDCLAKRNDHLQLRDILSSHNMRRIELAPTRITPTSQTSIDCVCTNLLDNELNVEVLDTCISDHTGQMCCIARDTDPSITLTTKRRHINNKNLLNLKEILKQEDWADVYNTTDINNAYGKFNTSIQRALNQTCPLISTRIKRKIKNVINDPAAIELKNQFLRAQNTFLLSGREDDKRRAFNLKKDYDLQLRQTRKQINITKIAESSNKSKTIWNVINSERKQKEESNQVTKLEIKGQETTSPMEIADYLNTFFTTIAGETIKINRPENRQLTPPALNRVPPNLMLTPTCRQEMAEIIGSLKPKSSAGYDEISAKLLKFCESELIDPLVNITNKSFSSGIFPSALKIAKVYPKFKNGSPTQASNYRPISLIPTFSKIIEKIVLIRLFDHLLLNQLLTENQHGFLAGKSTSTALISLVEFLLDQQEEGNTSTAVFLDYSKAFDCLDHDHLLQKLTTLGIGGSAQAWFSSYLSNRSQLVEITTATNGKTEIISSKLKPISRGVPQGSVLGPVLFILFTNDFPEYMQDYSKTLMYADDTVLLLGRPRADQLEVDSYVALNMAIQYCHNNDLVVNENKTKQLILGRQSAQTGRMPELEEINTTQYLGISLDDKLSWTAHINSLCSKLSTGIFVIRRMKNVGDMMTAKTAYHALFESHLRYGIAVWGGTTVGNLQRALVLQKRAIRILSDLQPRATCREAFRELKILTVINLYILEAITYVHIKEPESARRGLQMHQYNTRHANNYCLPVHNLSSTEKKTSYVGAKMWNALPDTLKKSDKLLFSRHLKTWLQDRPFYTLSEFFDGTM